jgi:hypothetical protein
VTNELSARITVLTAGHLSTCPRMLKAADALAAAGARVRVVSTRFMDWASAADAAVRRTRQWPWTVVDYSRRSGNGLRVRSGLRMRGASAIAATLGPVTPSAVLALAFARVHSELVEAIATDAGDLIYAGTATAFAAAAAAARRSGAAYALDLEDFHSGEHGDADADRDALAGAIERRVLAGARFLTTASGPMAAAYQSQYGVVPTVIHNVMPLPAGPVTRPRTTGEPLRLYWFSQTIGPGRGLEDVVRAAGRINGRLELHLRGYDAHGYVASLANLQRAVAPSLAIVHHPPAAPDEMIASCADHHVGLATEQPVSTNKAVCVSNKLFTYLAAGLPQICTATTGQRSIADRIGLAAAVVEPGDVDALARALKRWSEDPEALDAARSAAWDAASTRWHWEHPAERDALIELARGASRA